MAAPAPAALEPVAADSSAVRPTLLECLVAHATQSPGRTFCHFVAAGQTTPISYGSLWTDTRRWAELFLRRGVPRGAVVLVILDHRADLFAAFLGAMLHGAVPSFMPFPSAKQDPQLYWSSHRALFDRIGAGAIVTYAEHETVLREKVTGLPLTLLRPEEAQAITPPGTIPTLPSAESPALLQHSSGTTGLKKGVVLSYGCIARQLAHYAATIRATAADRWVSWLPLYHDMGLVSCFLLPLALGGTIVALSPFEWVADPASLFREIEKHRGTLCWLPNFAYHHLCRTVPAQPAPDLSSVRAFTDCSEPCKAETFDLFARTFGARAEQLQVCYAMAETVFAVTQTSLDRPAPRLRIDRDSLASGRAALAPLNASAETVRELLSTGRPIPGLVVEIRRDDDTTAEDGEVGEICVAGDCLFDGYHRLPELTAERLQAGWYRTGDLGFRHDGELYVTGRKDDLIISHGKNIYAHDVEQLANDTGLVKPGRAVAFGVFNKQVGSCDLALVAETDAAGDPAQLPALTRGLKQSLADRLPLVINHVLLVPPGWLVKTTSGKISRRENKLRFLAHVKHPHLS